MGAKELQGQGCMLSLMVEETPDVMYWSRSGLVDQRGTNSPRFWPRKLFQEDCSKGLDPVRASGFKAHLVRIVTNLSHFKPSMDTLSAWVDVMKTNVVPSILGQCVGVSCGRAQVWTCQRAESREQKRETGRPAGSRLSARESSLHNPETHTHQRRDAQRDAPSVGPPAALRTVHRPIPPVHAPPQPLTPIANSTHRPPPSPHQQPRVHAVRTRTSSITAHGGIASISWNAPPPLCPP
jgi:hypothetical protein